MSEKYERVGLRSIAEGKLVLVLLAGGQGIADPVFLGATIESGYACGSKVIRKAYPEERVGAICTLEVHALLNIMSWMI